MALAHLHIEAQNGPLSAECADRGIISFLSLIEWVTQLPYRRNSDRSDYTLVLKEECGACSTKNALVKAVALENGWDQIKLYLGIFMMSANTHPQLHKTLQNSKLEAIPEAHTYLKIDDQIKDVTGLRTGPESFDKSLQVEINILPEQIGAFKVNWHKEQMEIFAQKMGASAEELWKVREECITALSEVNV